MTQTVEFLKSLISVAGLSGHEEPVLEIIRNKWKPLVDEISVSRLGSLHALKRGRGRGKRPAAVIATHMDAIGLIVTAVTDGLLHFAAIGDVDARILPGTSVIVHGKRVVEGVVAMPPAKTMLEHSKDEAVGLSELIVDVGLPDSRAKQLVRPGDLISFNTMPQVLGDEFISGHSLDNRASVAALTLCLEELQAREHAWDVWAVASVQEETTYGGAATSAFELNPEVAIVVDVTFGKGPGASGWEVVPMGKGPGLGSGANFHPLLRSRLEEVATKLDMAVTPEFVPGGDSGTDASAIQVAREGIPTALLSIPLRYMHTPVEMVSIKDVQRAGRLLAEFICSLEPDFAAKIIWDREDADKQ